MDHCIFQFIYKLFFGKTQGAFFHVEDDMGKSPKTWMYIYVPSFNFGPSMEN